MWNKCNQDFLIFPCGAVMTFFHSIESVLSVYIIIGIGYLLTKRGIFNAETGGQFAWLVVNVTFPCYIIAALPEQFTAQAMADSFLGIIIAVIATLALYPVGYLVAKILKIPPERKHVFTAMIVFSNVVFIGLPVNYALFGDKAVAYVLQYYLANTVIFWTFGIYFIQLGSNRGIKPKINLKMILNPPLLATAIAIVLVLFDSKAPYVIRNSFQIVGNMTTPLATLFIGIVFSEIKLKDFSISRDMIAVAVCRFAVAPVLIYIPLVFTSFPPLMREVFFIQAAMPVMNQVTISSRYYGADYKYSTVITIWAFIISMFAIPVYVALFESGILG